MTNIQSMRVLDVSGNQKLTNLAGMDHLKSVTTLTIKENPKLTSLSELSNISLGVNGFLEIRDNENLSVCNLPIICTYLSGGGDATISGNAPGCESVFQVISTCNPAVSVEAPDPITVKCGTLFSDITFPETAKVTYSDHSTSDVAVTWQVGEYSPTPDLTRFPEAWTYPFTEIPMG